MTAWTWMRYSYLWDFTVATLARYEDDIGGCWPCSAYIAIRGEPVPDAEGFVTGSPIPHEDPDWDGLVVDPSTDVVKATVAGASVGTKCRTASSVKKAWRRSLIVFGDGPRPTPCHDALWKLQGRARPYGNIHPPLVPYLLDTTACRFHPASVAGLVVGTMGCFIFGLYLRKWFIDRKALASQPVQDMIA